MEIENVNVEALIPYARNSRTHTDAQVAQIAASIREFGFTNPVLIDEASGIIAGHGRLLAARKLGMEAVPCIRLSHLSETQKRAYVIADNKLAMNAGWDDGLLSLEISDLLADDFDLSLLGFSSGELDKLTSGDPSSDGEQKDVALKSTFEVIVECENETEQESVYHRMMEAGYKCRVLSI